MRLTASRSASTRRWKSTGTPSSHDVM
jgi:hypothetical protein